MSSFFPKLKNKLFGNYEWVVDFSEFITSRDVRKSRVTAVLGYLVFFIPLVFHGDSQYARFHANQSLINLLLSTVGAVLLSLIPYVGPYLMILQEAMSLVWMVRGMILAGQGRAESIPLVGWITILAYRLPGQSTGKKV